MSEQISRERSNPELRIAGSDWKIYEACRTVRHSQRFSKGMTVLSYA